MDEKDRRKNNEITELFSSRAVSRNERHKYLETGSKQSGSTNHGTQRSMQDTRGGTSGGVSQSPIVTALIRETRRELSLRFDASKLDSLSEIDIAHALDKVCAAKGYNVDDVVKADIVVNLKRDLLGWGILQSLIDNPDITDIHCYDYKTVVLQRGKSSELTGLRWANKEAYTSFIDRILFRLGKSVSTQQHTVDASFPDGKRINVVHESVCGARGPFLTMRVPRIANVTLDGLVSYEVAPAFIINYLAALIRECEYTMILSGETGTGKTTTIRCLGTQFKDDESIVGIEDTPELNFQHPYYRSLVSRYANTEGIGEVTLQEHIKTTLRMSPTRVILGEMRSPEAAEAFLESAQTGHVGISTIHARSARETLTRLEALLGRVQRGVSMDIIRQQIALAVDVIVWMKREKSSGRIRMAEIIEVGHFAEGMIQVRPMFSLVEEGKYPKWEVLSWSSNYSQALERNGIILGDVPRYLGFYM